MITVSNRAFALLAVALLVLSGFADVGLAAPAASAPPGLSKALPKSASAADAQSEPTTASSASTNETPPTDGTPPATALGYGSPVDSAEAPPIPPSVAPASDSEPVPADSHATDDENGHDTQTAAGDLTLSPIPSGSEPENESVAASDSTAENESAASVDGAVGHAADESVEELTLLPENQTDNESVDGLTAAVVDESSTADVCPTGAPSRSFTVHAIQVDTVYNKYGQHDPNGVMYVLGENVGAVRAQLADDAANNRASIANPDPDATASLVEPLVIRAHAGDCIDVTFVNELRTRASIHPTGVAVAPNDAGTAVGNATDSTAGPGETIRYRWYAEKVGAYTFADGANPVMHDGTDTLVQHGLFGALIVETAGTRWLDPKTGAPLASGTKAVVVDPNGPDFREFIIVYHDGAGVVNSDGSTPTWPHTNDEQTLYTLNYRGDPTSARLAENCPDCAKEHLFYSSWAHGDPGAGDLVFPSYLGDPVKYHVLSTAVEETHVHHHHGHRWKSEPGDLDSNTVDAQSLGAGVGYTQEFVAGAGQASTRPGLSYQEAFRLGGAGYTQGSAGDYLFHCHLFPHYAAGMWGILRVHDRTQDGLVQLPDRSGQTPAPASSADGFPNFIGGTDGYAPPTPPLSSEARQPTDAERAALGDDIVAGAPYANPCPTGVPVREYDVVVLQTDIVYNKHGDHDPVGRMYALASDEQKILSGELRPRPLTLRANAGDCLSVRFSNHLPTTPTADHMSMHIHFVGYDVLGSDGTVTGYNYAQGVDPGETITYRWYADEEGTVFFHDHMTGLEKGMHGTFGALVVEPTGSTWHDPYTGKRLDDPTTGALLAAPPHAVIVDPRGPDFREFVLYYQDFARLYDRSGRQINGPFTPAMDDQGTMGISYSNAPLWHRNGKDSAYAYSSWVHGDPDTPLLETYPGDLVKVRTLQGTHEEGHAMTVHATAWQVEPNDAQSPWVSTQTFGVSEQFEARFRPPAVSPGGVPVADYLYGSPAVDDNWNGMWGLLRVWGVKVSHLKPVPDNAPPTGTLKAAKAAEFRTKGIRLTSDGAGPKVTGPALKARGNSVPPMAPTPGNACPTGAPVRTYDVVAFTTDIRYNEFGDHDPYGVVFATAADYDAYRAGSKQVEPLVIRANAGDCISLRLTNRLPAAMSQHADHARVPVQQTWANSNRISLHPTLLRYDVQRSDGATVGFNWDQTVAPGKSLTYRWYAAEEGTAVLWDMADLRNHRHHGAYGLLVVEPRGSTWLDPYTGEPVQSGAQAMIVDPNGPDFREYALAFADGTYAVNPDGTCVVRPTMHDDDASAPCNQAIGDPEDQGFKAINYRSAPLGLDRRMKTDSNEHLVFSSAVHGDPDTPVLEAYAGDPVVFRVAQTADKPRGVSFHLAGHYWPYHSTEPGTQFVGVRGEFTPGVSDTVVPVGGAGGTADVPGDYYYGAVKLRNYVEGGMWGVFRVHPVAESTALQPLPDRVDETASTDSAPSEQQVPADAPTPGDAPSAAEPATAAPPTAAGRSTDSTSVDDRSARSGPRGQRPTR